jgi:hypothetical protein
MSLPEQQRTPSTRRVPCCSYRPKRGSDELTAAAEEIRPFVGSAAHCRIHERAASRRAPQPASGLLLRLSRGQERQSTIRLPRARQSRSGTRSVARWVPLRCGGLIGLGSPLRPLSRCSSACRASSPARRGPYVHRTPGAHRLLAASVGVGAASWASWSCQPRCCCLPCSTCWMCCSSPRDGVR